MAIISPVNIFFKMYNPTFFIKKFFFSDFYTTIVVFNCALLYYVGIKRNNKPQVNSQKKEIKKMEIEYFREDLTDMQKLYSAITGYEGPNSAFSSAKDDFYYDNCETLEEKIDHLRDYAENCLEISLDNEELIRVATAIDTESDGQNEEYLKFEKLEKNSNKILKAGDLSEEQQNEFINFFYDNWPAGFEKDLDSENPSPWGMPWYWCSDVELNGSSIKEMAINFFKTHECEIIECLEVDGKNLA